MILSVLNAIIESKLVAQNLLLTLLVPQTNYPILFFSPKLNGEIILGEWNIYGPDLVWAVCIYTAYLLTNFHY